MLRDIKPFAYLKYTVNDGRARTQIQAFRFQI